MAMDGVSDEGDEQPKHHTVILGWSAKVPSLLRQLAVANQSLNGGEITVVAAVELSLMEQEFKKHNIDMLGTTVKFLCGSRHDTKTLRSASIDTASAIIVLAESQDADESDELAVLVIRKILKVVTSNFTGHVVVEVIDVENEPRIKQAGGELVETVVAKDVITRLMVQCARQPGLAQVWKDILGFDKAEFYLKRWPELDGMQFLDVLISFPDAIPCGVKVASRNKIVLNPDNEYVLSEGDEVLVIADDDDSYAPSTSLPELLKPGRPAPSSPTAQQTVKLVKKVLFCGWQRGMEDMIPVLDQTLGPGSELWIFTQEDLQVATEELENVTVTHCVGKPTVMKDMEALPLETFDSILLVADGTNADEQEPLSSLIMIKSIQAKRLPYRESRAVQIRPAGNAKSAWIDELQHCAAQSIIVSEILNAQTKEAIKGEDHEIEISDEMVSMALAMVAEDKRISGVLEELFAEEGNEMFMRPGEMFLKEDMEELSFYDIMMRARARKEIVIGYHRESEEVPVINPSNKAAKQKWLLDDSFIVLVERR